jgi:hypothetical protein
MPEKIIEVINWFKGLVGCFSFLFCANITGKSDKQIRGIRIAETVIGTLICTIILGGLGSYIVLSKLETAFKHQNIYINTQLEHVEKKRLEDKESVRRELDNIMYDIRELRGD